MASLGTGLPLQHSDPVLTQPGSTAPLSKQINADAFSNAESWAQIAQAGARLSDAAGDYAKVEIHQAKVGYLAAQDVEIARKRADMRDQFDNDPQSFDAHWTAYKDGKIGAAEPWAVPHLTRQLGSEGNAAYSALLAERRATDRRLDGERIQSLASLTGNDVIGAAMAGSLSTPDGQIKLGKYKAVLDSAVTSNLMTQEKADFLFDTTISQAQGEIAARDGVQVYKEKGFDAAVAHLKSSILENDNLSLKGESRYKAFNRGLQAIRLEKQIDSQDRAAVVQESKDFVARVKSGQEYTEPEFQDMHAALGRVGATSQQAQLVIEHGVRQATLGQDLRGLAVTTASYRAGTAALRGTPEQASAVTTAATNLGVSPRDLAAAISYETGGKFDPNVVGGKGNNYVGLIQFGPEERAKYGIRPGMTIEQQMPAVEAFLRDRGVKPGMGISEIYRTINGGNPNASLNASDGNGTIAQHIERIKASHYGNADRFLGGTGAVDSTDQAGQITRRVQQVFVTQARKTWSEIEPQIDAGKPVDDQVITDMRYAAQLSGDDAWIKKTTEMAAARKLGDAITPLPVSQGQGAVDQVRQNFSERVAKSVETQFARKNKAVKEDPIGYSIENGLLPPAPIDFSQPATVPAAVNQRVTIAQGVATEQGTPMGNVFRPAETAAIAGAITAGDPARASAALQAIASLPDEALTPALGNSEIKAAVAGAARSTEVPRYTAAMQFLDRLWARSPETTKALFGEDQIHALMTWQTNLRYMTPEQLTKERERTMLDPQVRERVKVNEKEGRELAGKYTFDDVVKTFDSSWWVTPGSVARAIGSQPLAPTDALTRDTMMGDFNNIYARRYAETLDKDKALEQATALMKTKWAASPANGGRLMLNAPETLRDGSGNAIYPAIDGKYDWMTKQVERDIGFALAAQRGMTMTEFDTARPTVPMVADDATGLAPKRNWSYTLVSDGKTQSEARAGQPASYQVVVTDAETGRLNVMPQRFRFDPAEDQGKRRTDFEQQRARLRAWEEQFTAGPEGMAFP